VVPYCERSKEDQYDLPIELWPQEHEDYEEWIVDGCCIGNINELNVFISSAPPIGNNNYQYMSADNIYVMYPLLNWTEMVYSTMYLNNHQACKWLVKNGGDTSPERNTKWTPLHENLFIDVSWLELQLLIALDNSNLKMAIWIRNTYGDIRPSIIPPFIQDKIKNDEHIAEWERSIN
jgi:hypothetical protein